MTYIDKIAELAVSISKAAENNEKFLTASISSKLKKCAEVFPHDSTVVMLSNVVSKLSDKQAFISKGELRKLYNQFYVRNTKCAELLKEELGEVNKLATPTLSNRVEEVELDTSVHADPILANALEGVLNGGEIKMYSKKAAEGAKLALKNSFSSQNLNIVNITVDSGDKDFIVAKADFETPKGITSFYIPVEVNGDKVVNASVFMGNGGVNDFTKENVQGYLLTNAGSKLKIKGSDILEVLRKAADAKSEVNDVQLAFARLKASKLNKAELGGNPVIGLELEKVASEVATPRLKEADTFAEKLATHAGLAGFKFGNDKVNKGTSVIARALLNLGYKNPSIKVSGHNDENIFYAVSLDAGRVGFVAPIKVASNKVSEPSVFLSNGSVFSFNSENINKLYVDNKVSDKKMAAFASPLHDLKPSDLINQIREAVSNHNLTYAEEALNVLKQAGDEKAYIVGFKAFSAGLANKKENHEEASKCSMQVKNSASKHLTCGHTGLPLHKVYQDNHGNCQPLYRKGMDESYEGGYFMNHKIFG